MTENNGTSATRVMPVTNQLNSILISVRGRRSDVSSSSKSTPAKGLRSGSPGRVESRELPVASGVAIISLPLNRQRHVAE